MKKLNLVEKLIKEIDVFDLELVNDYISKLDISNNSKRMYVYQLKKFYKQNCIPTDELHDYQQTKNFELRGLSYKEVELIKNYWKNEKDYYLVFCILVETGLRLGEFLSVDWTKVKETQIKTKTLKNKDEYRTVYITKETLNLLNDHSISLVSMNRNKIQYILAKMGEAVNLSIKLTPHTCRRTKGTLMRMNGAAIEDIADILGHESMECTRIYYAKLNHSYLESISNLSNIDPIDSIDLINLKKENELLKKKIYFLESKLSEYEK